MLLHTTVNETQQRTWFCATAALADRTRPTDRVPTCSGPRPQTLARDPRNCFCEKIFMLLSSLKHPVSFPLYIALRGKKAACLGRAVHSQHRESGQYRMLLPNRYMCNFQW
jgi:hypothetical protein